MKRKERGVLRFLKSNKKIINENVIDYQKIYTNDLTTQKS